MSANLFTNGLQASLGDVRNLGVASVDMPNISDVDGWKLLLA